MSSRREFITLIAARRESQTQDQMLLCSNELFVVEHCPYSNSVPHRGVHSHESQELSCWSPGCWLLRRNVHAHDESWERASGPKSREGHGDIEGRDGEIGHAQGRGNRSDSRQDDPGLVFWLNQGEQRLHDCRQGQG